LHLVGHRGGVGREEARHKAASRGRQVHRHHAAVVPAALAAHPAMLFEVVNDQGDVPAAFEQLLPELALAQRPEMQEGLERPELADGEPGGLVRRRRASGQGVGGAKQGDIGVEGANLLGRASVVCRHIRSISDYSMSN
jgi:hypothetical protein